ncbi:MAG TPA: GAF domain-containing sensor histidine kinase [Thermoanaerobaculia bacterium]|nr:GAF domain-containing sensor histidine kinase [Thermoanaerobaculia bacterium]
MALVPTERSPGSRKRAMGIFLRQAVVGLLLLVWLTATRTSEPAQVFRALGPSAPILIAILVAFAFSLATLKFALTEQIFVSLLITAVLAIFPLLGPVLTSWIAVCAAIAARLLSINQIGPVKIDMSDPMLEYARTVGLLGTYGIPAVLATLCYELIGGEVPLLRASVAAALRIALCAIVVVVTNSIVTGRVEWAYGYSLKACVKLGLVDSSIYILTLPYAFLITFSYGGIGWGGVLAATFSGVIANLMGRRLAVTRTDKERLVQRLASLMNIGKTISLRHSTDELLMTIYEECRKVIDVSMFSIALLDVQANELCSALIADHGAFLPPSRFPLGEGLTSWVIEHGRPLRLASSHEEQALGLASLDDGLPTESWLGVPMIARDHILGVISLQSYKVNAFTEDDAVLLTSIANQAAVAIDDANLYQDLERLNLALEARVLERTGELRETNLRLEAADRSKNQFLANMSHELRTPLNSIIGFSGVLIEATENVLQPRLYKFLLNIKTAGTHLLNLINDILDLSKIESGKLELSLQTFDLRETIAMVERVMKGIAAESRVSIITNIDPTISEVHLDEARIKQILLNLLSNAVKFSHPGSFVYLTVSRLAESAFGCDSLSIDVKDQGIGMPAQELEKVFDEFYQINDPRAAHKRGTGLGLSLTRSFVDLHQGTVAVQSVPGEGSTFTIQLPLDYRKVAPRQTRQVNS